METDAGSEKINGDQAMAFGALAGGVKVVTSYPGAPSIGTVQALIRLSKTYPFYVEWSCNEKVAMEMGIGASIAGARALVCVKSVGMNLVLDPLMALNLTPVKAGLVILLGDDPGGYGSQNDQDTRSLASFLEMPMLEPATPVEGYKMMQAAFDLSEKYNTAVIVRETRGFTLAQESFSLPPITYPDICLGFEHEPWRFVPVPKNAVEKHKHLHQRLARFMKDSNGFQWNHASGDGPLGIVAAGFVYTKLMDILRDTPRDRYKVFKLSAIYPLPEASLARFLETCERVLILEETEPYVERHIKALAHDLRLQTRISGKQSGLVPKEGELYRWQIQEALAGFLPGYTPNPEYTRENEINERPKMKSHCADQGYGDILDILETAAGRVNQELALAGDPGCLVTVAQRLDAKYAIGSAVGVADGMYRAGIKEKPVAVFGDSSFFHTSIPAICNAVYNKSRILMVVLDNKAAVTTGFQPNPGTGKNAQGDPVPPLDIEKIARAVGVTWIKTSAPDDPDAVLEKIFQDALVHQGLAMVIVKL